MPNTTETLTFTVCMSSNNTTYHLEPESLLLLCNPVLLLTNTFFFNYACIFPERWSMTALLTCAFTVCTHWLWKVPDQKCCQLPHPHELILVLQQRIHNLVFALISVKLQHGNMKNIVMCKKFIKKKKPSCGCLSQDAFVKLKLLKCVENLFSLPRFILEGKRGSWGPEGRTGF